jgi:hypothetical protein
MRIAGREGSWCKYGLYRWAPRSGLSALLSQVVQQELLRERFQQLFVCPQGQSPLGGIPVRAGLASMPSAVGAGSFRWRSLCGEIDAPERARRPEILGLFPLYRPIRLSQRL